MSKSQTFYWSAAGTAHWFGPWIDCSERTVCGFSVLWSAFAATAGELFLEGSDFPTPTESVAADAKPRFANAAMGWFLNGTLALPVVTAAEGNATLRVLHPMKFHRIAYQFAAGGTAAQFSGAAHLR